MADTEQAAWIERVLGVSLAPTTDGLYDPDLDPDAEKAELTALGLSLADMWASAIEAFEAATEAANEQVRRLQAALRETDDPDLHDIADSGLNALTGNTRVPLMAAIQAAGKGGPEQLKSAAPKLLKAVGAFRARLASEQVAACDRNPFGVDMDLKQTYEGALDQLAHAAQLAA